MQTLTPPEETPHRNFEVIAHMIPDIIYKLDSDGRFTYINNSIRNLGYEPVELMNKHFSMLIHPEDLDKVQRSVATGNGGKSAAGTGRHPKLFDERRTGKRITKDLLVRLVPKNQDAAEDRKTAKPSSYRVISVGSYHRASSGTPREFNGTLGVIRNTSEPGTSEDVLLRCIDYYHSLVELSNDVFFVIATDGTILFTSPTLRKVLGYRTGDLAGENVVDYIRDDDYKKVIKSYNVARDGKRYFNVRLQIRHKEGSWRTFEASGKVINDPKEKAMYATVLIRDITRTIESEETMKLSRGELERQIAEQNEELAIARNKLQAEMENRSKQDSIIFDSETKYHSLVNSIADIVLNMDPEGSILFINPAVEKISGHSQEEMIGSNILEYIHREDVDRFLDSISQERADRGDNTKLIARISADSELRMIRKDGSSLWIELRCRPVSDRSGNIIGFRGIAHDITRRKQTEEEIIRQSKIESLGILAAGIAHDFNNMLTAILGNISLAKASIPENQHVHSILDEAESASTMAKNLTQQLLAFSRGGSPVKKLTTPQNLIIDTAYFVLRGSNILCSFDLSDSLMNAEIDRGQISQVIHNIILNARQAMPDGGTISVSAHNVEIDEMAGVPLRPGSYIKISIADEGHGIPDEIINKVFDPYFTTKETGNGLGLALSYSIIKKHDGFISVESRGKGTMFSIYLPASRKLEDPGDAPSIDTGHEGGRVLVMDDEKIIVDLAGKLLHSLGYDVTSASNGVEAVREFAEAKNAGRPFDIVLLDLIIPGGKGADKIIGEIREIDPDAKIIVTSGYADDPVMVDYSVHGFSGSLAKPFNLGELDQELSRVLRPKKV